MSVMPVPGSEVFGSRPLPLDELRRERLAGSSRDLSRSRGGMLLGTLLRDTREQSTDLGLPVAPVPPQRAD